MLRFDVLVSEAEHTLGRLDFQTRLSRHPHRNPPKHPSPPHAIRPGDVDEQPRVERLPPHDEPAERFHLDGHGGHIGCLSGRLRGEAGVVASIHTSADPSPARYLTAHVSSPRPGAVEPPKTRDEFLVTPVVELAGLWLVVTCGGCRQVTRCRLTRHTFRREGDRPLREVFGRLRCSHCGGRASAVRLANSMTGPVYGSSLAAWDVALLP